MAEKYGDEPVEVVQKRQELFLAKNHLAPLSRAYLSVVPNPGLPPIVDITSDAQFSSPGPTVVQAETIFTTLPQIPLMHKPADCPTAIIFSSTSDCQSILGLAHLGRPQINKRVVEQTFTHLFRKYSAIPHKTYLGISPSIGPKHYIVKKKDQNERHLLDLSYWNECIFNDVNEIGEEIIRVDVLKKILSLLSDFEIPQKNIQAYGHFDAVDTYALAQNNPPLSYSHRYAVSTGQPEKNGRILVVAQLTST